MSPRNMMPIGRFSRSCRLSIKSLRYYAQVGLLVPAHVDPSTGYRYYTADQAKDAVLIGMLRGLDVPVERVRRLLAANAEERKLVLEQERDRMASEIQKRKRALDSIERLVAHGDLVPYDHIEVRREPSHTVAVRVGESRAETLVEDGGQLVMDLFEELQALGRGYENPVMCINEDPDRSGRIAVKACIGVSEPVPDLITETLPEVEVAWLVHRGSYDTLGLAYHALDAWSQSRGHARAAPMREVYLNDPGEVAPEDLLTEV
ncbi:MAG: MerR family transcriptional regulator, partial [Myxococcota bacterium]